MKKLNILIVGGGMYVSGRGTKTFGTVIPALLEARRYGLVDKIGIATTNNKTALYVKETFLKLSSQMQVNDQCYIFPKEGQDENAYLNAVDIFNPDAAVISVPDHLHSSISIPLINKGLHCLVVKPMASNVNEAKLMLNASKKAKVIGEVEFHKRFDESNLILHDKFQSNQLGDLLYCLVEYSQQKKIPIDIFKSWSEKSNVFQYLAVHYVDLIQFITGYTPIDVTAWGQKKYLVDKGINTWDSIQAVIKWEKNNNKFTSTHITNWIDPNKTSAISDQRIIFVGTKGRYDSNQKNRGNQFVNDENGIDEINPYFSSRIKTDKTSKINYTGYGIRSIIQFIKDVQDYKNNNITLEEIDNLRPSFNQAIISTAVNEAVLKSLTSNNKTIKIEY